MGEIEYAWSKIKKDISVIGNILIFAFGIYFTVQSVNNSQYFYFMYVRPIVNFINEYIIPMFAV